MDSGVFRATASSVQIQLAREVADLISRVIRHRRALLAVTRLELKQRYAGSVLGSLWYPLYWALLLGMYCFVYIAIFRQRVPEFGEFGYVLFIFAGLVPYFGISDAISSGTMSVRSNLAFHRNAVFPIELIPVKTVLVALASQAIAVAILAIMAAGAGLTGWHMLYLPVPFVFELLFVVGAVWILSAVNVVLPDVQQGVTLALWLFLFVSPIGFTIAQVPERFRWVLWLNPLTYLIEEFRFGILGVRTLAPLLSITVLVILAVAMFLLGALVFRTLVTAIGDYA